MPFQLVPSNSREARAVFLVACLALLGFQPARGQGIPNRSTDYLFLSTATDTRSIWLNPAGLAAGATASLMGELVFDRPEGGDVRVGQWSAGFASRGLGFSYQRDRIPSEDATDAFRLGAALPFPDGSVGVAFTFYRSDGTDRAVDLGVRYRPRPSVALAATIRNLGRPEVRAVPLPVTAAVGAGWHALPAILVLAGEAHVAERIGDSGYDTQYRLGASLSTPRGFPLGAFASLAWDSGFSVDRWALGLSVGGPYRALLVSSGEGSSGVDRLSLTGLAVRELSRR